MYSTGQILVPATGLGPAMGLSLLAGYPVVAATFGVAAAMLISIIVVRRKKSARFYG